MTDSLVCVAYRYGAALRCLLIFCVLMLSAPVSSEDEIPFEQQFEAWQGVIAAAEDEAQDSAAVDEDLKALRAKMQALLDEIRTAAEQAEPRLTAAKEQLDGLGPAPAEGEAPEAEQVAMLREQQTQVVADLEGIIKNAGLLTVRTEQVLSTISDMRLSRFTTTILERGPSPLDPGLWADAFSDRSIAWDSLTTRVSEWWQATSVLVDREVIAVLSGAVLVAFVINFPLRRSLLRVFHQDPTEIDPTYLERCAAAIWVAAIRSALPILSILAVYLILELYGLLDRQNFPEVVDLIDTTVYTSILLMFVSALSRSFLAPQYPAWRVFPIPDASARRMTWLLIAVATLYAIHSISTEVAELTDATVNVLTQKEFIFNCLLSVLLLLVLSVRLKPQPVEIYQPTTQSDETDTVAAYPEGDEALTQKGRVPVLRIALGIFVVSLPIMCLLGYIPLARFLSGQLVITGSIVAGVYIVYVIAQELFSEGIAGQNSFARSVRKSLALSEEGADVLAFWLYTAFTILLVIAGALFILLSWGIAVTEIGTWVSNAFFGVEIGGFTFSLYAILIAIALFTAVMLISRLFQGWLEKRVLPRTKLDAGVRNSIRTSVGYIGLVLAAVVAFSYIGLDLSNLAIVAGALSVGIGFGLQSIVNNFVSGLILLAERPIKVGDWIVVGAEQGYVKRISVRATEVETFDRCSVIIPNSTLISDQVKNWTLKDKLGRIIVGVGVAYGTDVEEVREILLHVAREHPNVAHYPVPFVYFKDFGASSLDFELRCFLVDIENALSTASAIRFAIVKQFEEHGIAIPFPQRDIHIISEPASKPTAEPVMAPTSPLPEAKPQATPEPDEEFVSAAAPAEPATPIEIRSATEVKKKKKAKKDGSIDAAPLGTVVGEDGDSGNR